MLNTLNYSEQVNCEQEQYYYSSEGCKKIDRFVIPKSEMDIVKIDEKISFSKNYIRNNNFDHPTGFQRINEINFFKNYNGFNLKEDSNFQLKWKNDENTFVVPYDERWVEEANKEINYLRSMCPYISDIEHIGSTAVTGMVARPTIDLIIAIKEDKNNYYNLENLLNNIRDCGYKYIDHETRKDRLFFIKPQKDNPSGIPTHHLHICLENSPYWKVRIGLRNLLRENEYARNKYINFKLMITKHYPNDRYVYYMSKTSCIVEILDSNKIVELLDMHTGLFVIGCDW